MRESKIALPGPFITVIDPQTETIPVLPDKAPVAATDSAVSVRCREGNRGSTKVVLGLVGEVNPWHQAAYGGRIRTRKGALAIRTSGGEEILSCRTNYPEVFLSIWTNHPIEPDQVFVGFSTGDPREEFLERLVSAHRDLQPLLREHMGDNDELLSYVFMADVIRFAEEMAGAAERGDVTKAGELRRFLNFMEAEFAIADPEVDDLIHIELLESVMQSTDLRHLAMRKLLGPVLAKRLLEMEAWRPHPEALMMYALRLYAEERVTLGWAAEYTRTSVLQVAEAARAQGIPLRASAAFEIEEAAKQQKGPQA